MLEQVKLEMLTSEELAMSKSRLGVYNCNIKCVRLEFAEWCIVDLYRIVLYPKSVRGGIKTRLDMHIAAMLEGIALKGSDSSGTGSVTPSSSGSEESSSIGNQNA